MSTDTTSTDIPRTMRASVLVTKGQVQVEERSVAMAERFGATTTVDPVTEPVADLGVDAFIDCSGTTADLTPGSLKAVVQP